MDAATITALGAVIIAIIGAVFSGLQSLKTGRKVDDVHTVVNGTTTRALARNEQLTAALTEANVTVPVSPAPPTGDAAP